MPSKPRRYDLAEVIKAELAKTTPVEIVAGDETFTVLPPILWPDEVFEVTDMAGARILLGDRYEALVAAGGTAKLLFSIITDAQGATLPE